MFRSIALAAVALCLSAAAVRADEKYTSANGKFSATFPDKPKEFSTPDADVNPGMGKYKYFSAWLEAGKDISYGAMYHDYPQGTIKDEPQLVLERVKDGWKFDKGRVIEDREIALGTDKVPGRTFIIAKEGFHYRVRIYLKDARLYQVVVVGKTKDDVATAPADKFLDSFEITK